MHREVRKRHGCASGKWLQRTETCADVINDLRLQVKHRTDIVTSVKLDGVVCARQAVVALDSTKGAIQRHLAGPGQNGGLAAVRTIQREFLRWRSRAVHAPAPVQQGQQTGHSQAAGTRLQNKRARVRAPQAGRQKVNDTARWRD